MKFYCIAGIKNEVTIKALEASCKERGLEFVLIDPEKFDLTYFADNGTNNILYRVSIGILARQVERHLVNLGTFTTLYTNADRIFFTTADTPLHEYLGIKIPKTINYLPKDEELLARYAKYIGGFPLIVKTNGLSHGKGVQKADSIEDLITISNSDSGDSIMRQYVEHDGHARLIVLGGKVVDSIEYLKPDDDFRTNVGEPNVRPKVYSSEIEEAAVRSVVGMGLDFAGVDVLIGNNGEHYLAEVNFPCFFMRAQDTTGVDIAGQMIDFLIKKAQVISST